MTETSDTSDAAAEPGQIIASDVSDNLLRRLLLAVFAAHKLAFEDTSSGYEATEAENLLPYMRRARVEGSIRDAAAMVDGVTADVLKSKNSNWNHTEISSGRVLITASSVQSPAALVEPAEFRQTLAQGSQYVLWPEPGDEPDEDAPLYALLLHGKSYWQNASDRRRYGHLPGSLYLAVPAPDLRSYVYDINLFDRFADTVSSLVPRDWNEEAKVSYLKRARKIMAS